jgi:hypothetical protein
LEWLKDQGFLLDSESLLSSKSLLGNKKFLKTSKGLRRELKLFKKGFKFSLVGIKELISKKDHSSMSSIYEYLRVQAHFLCRLDSSLLREFHNMDAFPVIDSIDLMKLPDNLIVPSRKTEIVKVVLNSLPVPDDSVPWEQILDYRNDSDSKERVLSLRRWINRLSGEKLSIAETQDEIEWLMHEYQKHMKLHKMKVNLMTLEASVKAPLELIENLVKINWSKLLDPLFTVKKRKIAILEAEINAPGRELSYIIKTRGKFRKH